MMECHQALKQHDKLKFLNKKQFKCSTFWIVPHHHVTVLEKSIEGGHRDVLRKEGSEINGWE